MTMSPIGPIKALIVHHTATTETLTAQRLYDMHVRDRGWSHIGYHYLVEWPGEVRYCRPVHRMGAHARGHNRGTLALAIAGDNTVPGREWTPRQIQAGQRVIDAFQLLYPGLPVLGHREVADTLCPGVDLKEVFVLGGS